MMSTTRVDRLTAALYNLQANTADVEATAIVSVDGLIIASALPSNAGEDRVAAMSAAMLSLGERIAGELRRGTLQQVYIRGRLGYVLLLSVGDDAVLTVLAHSRAKLGLIFLEMQRAVETLSRLL
jgi:uncharacterized protein